MSDQLTTAMADLEEATVLKLVKTKLDFLTADDREWMLRKTAEELSAL